MKTMICQESLVGLEELQTFVAQAEASDSSLACRNTLFTAHLQREQRKARQRILVNPDSAEARDFNFAFKPCYS